ncbi:MAG TPA: hypothetical protein PLW65_13120, partial [Pseudomonadota bacterium]|nr:hypothetical protein [Pseudomonadota bacterium]
MKRSAPQTYRAEIVGPVDDSRTVWFRLNTGARDRHGTIFEPAGLRLENFIHNPAFVWNHRDAEGTAEPDDAIGRVLQLKVDDASVLIQVEFARTRKAELCLKQVQDGFLRMVSVRALPLRKHQEGDVTVYDEWELWSASLCIVGSNPEALALRYLLSMPEEISPMDVTALLEKLGLAEGATFEQMLVACATMCARSDEDKAMLAGVMAAKPEPMSGEMADAERGADSEEDAEDKEADTAERAAGDDKPPMLDKGAKDSDPAMRAALAMALEAARAAQAKKPAGAAAQRDPVKWVDAQIKAGRWAATGRAQLLALARSAPTQAARAVKLIPEGSFPVHRERLG